MALLLTNFTVSVVYVTTLFPDLLLVVSGAPPDPLPPMASNFVLLMVEATAHLRMALEATWWLRSGFSPPTSVPPLDLALTPYLNLPKTMALLYLPSPTLDLVHILRFFFLPSFLRLGGSDPNGLPSRERTRSTRGPGKGVPCGGGSPPTLESPPVPTGLRDHGTGA